MFEMSATFTVVFFCTARRRLLI